MKQKQDRYHELETMLTVFVILDLLLFIGYLATAITAVLAAKIICAVLAIAVSGYGLWVLYNTRELTRQRSLWLTCSFGGILLCTAVSLLCNFP